MLVLSRKPGEWISIGEDVWVEVRRVAGNRVTLAIEAPKHVHILRGELEPYGHEFADEAPSQALDYRVEHYRVRRGSDRGTQRAAPASV